MKQNGSVIMLLKSIVLAMLLDSLSKIMDAVICDFRDHSDLINDNKWNYVLIWKIEFYVSFARFAGLRDILFFKTFS